MFNRRRTCNSTKRHSEEVPFCQMIYKDHLRAATAGKAAGQVDQKPPHLLSEYCAAKLSVEMVFRTFHPRAVDGLVTASCWI